MDAEGDEMLVRAALAGDGEAFARLVRRYQDYAYGTAIGLLSDFELARDVVQESFLAAFRDLRKCRHPERFGAWLAGIVRNTARRAIRELARVRAIAETIGRAAPPEPAPSPDEAALGEERRQIVRHALQRLTDNCREAVSLHYVDGLSYADIADYLDITEGAVLGRLQRGRAALKKELLTMVAEEFSKERLPGDFAAEIQRLLAAAESRGRPHEEAIDRLAEIGRPAVDPLCEALGDKRMPVRRAAAAALCRIGDARALRPVLRTLYGDWEAALPDAFGSGRVLAIPGLRGELLRLLREGEPVDSYLTIQALWHARGDEAVFDCLWEVVRDRGRRLGLRNQALSALLYVKPEQAEQTLAQALADPVLARAAGYAWWQAVRRGYRVPVGVCLPMFTRRTPAGVRIAAAQLLLRRGAEGRRALEHMLTEGSADQRATAAMGLAEERDPRAFDVLVEELPGGRGGRKLKDAASRLLARQYPRELLARLREARDAPATVNFLVWSLARAGGPDAAQVAEELYAGGTPAARAAALRILARQRGEAVLPELRRCLRLGRPRKVAREAFRQMRRLGTAAEPAAREMLASDRWAERKAAAALLRRWGALTSEEKAAAESDSHVAVRHAARWHPRSIEATGWHPKWGHRPARGEGCRGRPARE
jgi:RNA polymerase sigma-70 factor (ECF subfamily)